MRNKRHNLQHIILNFQWSMAGTIDNVHLNHVTTLILKNMLTHLHYDKTLKHIHNISDFGNIISEYISDRVVIVYKQTKHFIFVDAFGEPGDNSLGAAIFYNIKTKTPTWIFTQEDDSVQPTHKGFNNVVRRYVDFTNSHEEYKNILMHRTMDEFFGREEYLRGVTI